MKKRYSPKPASPVITGLLLFFAASRLASAQNYSVDWYNISSGGGKSSGGSFTLVTTTGQCQAGSSSGGNYSLEGGFLSGIALVQTTGAPVLSIEISGATAVISWQVANSSDFTLEEAVRLDSGGTWITTSAPVVTNGTVKSVTVPAAHVKFFRLRKP